MHDTELGEGDVVTVGFEVVGGGGDVILKLAHCLSRVVTESTGFKRVVCSISFSITGKH